jgi:hypothetical protein
LAIKNEREKNKMPTFTTEQLRRRAIENMSFQDKYILNDENYGEAQDLEKGAANGTLTTVRYGRLIEVDYFVPSNALRFDDLGMVEIK